MVVDDDKAEEGQRWSPVVKTVHCAGMQEENLAHWAAKSGDGTLSGVPAGRCTKRAWPRSKQPEAQFTSSGRLRRYSYTTLSSRDRQNFRLSWKVTDLVCLSTILHMLFTISHMTAMCRQLRHILGNSLF